MVRATLPAGKLNEALEAVAVLVDTATIEFGPDGLRVQTVDEAKVGAVSLTLLSGAFDEFNGSEMEMSVDVSRLLSLISEIDPAQPVCFEYEQDSHEVRVDAGSYEFDIRLIDPNSVHSGHRARDIHPPAEVKISTEEFKRTVRLASKFAEETILGIDADRELFYINVSGDNDSMAVSFGPEDKALRSIDSEPAHTVVSLKYLLEMVNAVPSASDLKLGLGKSYPVRLEFDIANEDGRVVYGLAPRLTE